MKKITISPEDLKRLIKEEASKILNADKRILSELENGTRVTFRKKPL